MRSIPTSWARPENTVRIKMQRAALGLPALLILAALGGCSLLQSSVGSTTRSSIASLAWPGMKLSQARANVASSGFQCSTRSGAWFDENGEEHPISGTFVSCMQAEKSGFSFACGQRSHVVLVPNGSRVQRVIVDTAPACTNLSPTVPRRPQDP